MKNDFMMAINQVCHERQLLPDVVLEAVEVALISAYKRNFGEKSFITAQIEAKSGTALIFLEKIVVEQVEDENYEISLEEASSIDPKIELGGFISMESTPSNFGRIAAQTAKQVILQRIREAERDVLYNTYIERKDEVVNGTVQKIEPHQVTLSLGKVEAYLPRNEQIPTERYTEGQRLRAYVASVSKTNRGPQIIVSRTHRNMLRRLLEVEVPEIYNGTVEIKSIAREAGYRSKVAVAALQEGVDPVGSCVGMRGTRIQNIVDELNGEKIDVVQWNPDLSFFIANSLSPAKVMNVMLHDNRGKTAEVIVPDKQLSLAIGKEGQNARLAAKLTNWRIDIKSSSEAAYEAINKVREIEAIQERVTAKLDLFDRAEAILDEKEPVNLTEGELNILSEAIEAVSLVEMTISRERIAQMKTKEAVDQSEDDGFIDILAEAEAILGGQLPTESLDDPEATPPPVVEDNILLEAQEILGQAEETKATVTKVKEVAEVTTTADLPAETKEVIAKQVEQKGEKPKPVAPPVKNEWLEEELDEEEKLREKKKARQKRRRLVYDEKLGEVVAERRHKRKRSGGWLDFDDDEEEDD